jgi:hypothetical protein
MIRTKKNAQRILFKIDACATRLLNSRILCFEQILCKGGENLVVTNKLAFRTQVGLICF